MKAKNVITVLKGIESKPTVRKALSIKRKMQNMDFSTAKMYPDRNF